MMRIIPEEIMKLIDLCHKNGLNIKPMVDDFHDAIIVLLLDKNGKRIGDAICHESSYGHELGLLEIMGKGCPESDVLGWLTAEEVVEKWKG